MDAREVHQNEQHVEQCELYRELGYALGVGETDAYCSSNSYFELFVASILEEE